MRLNSLMLAGLLVSSSLFAAPVKFDKSSGPVEWVGKKNIAGEQHNGTVDLKAGTLDLAAKKGEFVIDMNTVTPLDLKDAKKKGDLAGHLMSPDFFETTKYPEAKFVVKDIVKVAGSKDQYDVIGDLTIKDKTHPETIRSTIVENGKVTSIDSAFKFSRSKYNVNYKPAAEAEAAAKKSLAEKAKGAAKNAVKAGADAWIVDDIELSWKLKSI